MPAASVGGPVRPDEAYEPLMASPNAALAEEEEEEEDAAAGRSVWLLTLAAGISGLLFGYDTGVISAMLVSLGDSLGGHTLTSLDKSLITSATALAALVASPCASLAADRLGRRSVVLLADTAFAAGAWMQAAAGSVGGLVAGRVVVGLAIGAASVVVPVYVAELAPTRHRGRLLTVNVVMVTLGQVAAYVVGWALAEHGPADGSAWRWMVGLGVLPALLQAFLASAMPESPRWLVMRGRSAEAREVVCAVAGNRWDGRKAARMADAIVKTIEMDVRQESGELNRTRPAWVARSRWTELFSVPRNRRALAIACLLQGLQQLCGFNSLMYFSATIFSMIGFSNPTVPSLSVAMTNFAFSVLALFVVDRVGRRRILLWSIPVMMVGLLAAAAGFAIRDHAGTEAGAGAGRAWAATVILASVVTYVAAYAVGLGTVPWMQSELFGLRVRSLGSGLATSVNWAANFAVGLSFLPMADTMGAASTFVLYAVICAVGLVMISNCYPETAGLSLEQAAALLEHGWGVSRRAR